MKRSELNKIISDAIQFVEKREIPLPPFAYWGPEEWKKAGEEDRELVDNMLGWDITDFGSGDFEKIGLTIFTFRNGKISEAVCRKAPSCRGRADSSLSLPLE